MKKQRHALGISQAKLAERADMSTQYIAMIELQRKFPAPETMERIAEALELDTPELFSMPPSPAGTLRKLHKEVLIDIQPAVLVATEQAVKNAVAQVITARLKTLE